ncbi:MAG: hypothetical protein J2P20_20880 [Pseudonocardia sp.]|nr:hypothetical protein [Pseudonocardia sp.]
MRIRCVVTAADGSVLCSDSSRTENVNVRTLANAGHVVRMLRASNVVPEVGQKLTVWIEED